MNISSSIYHPPVDMPRTRLRRISHQSAEHVQTSVDAQVETTKKVLQLVEDSGLLITQRNGQRKLGPPPNWNGPTPDAKCEVFVGKLPRDLCEYEIYPIFRSIGEIYEIRLMMDFSGTNRGYCFVMYTNPRDACRAIDELNGFEIQSGKKIGVVASINNCRLCVTHLPTALNTKAFIKKIFDTTSGVEKVAVHRLADNRPKNALIFYKTHIEAAMARRRLVPERFNFIDGAQITIDWAHPNLFPENVVEECGTLDENGTVKVEKRFIDIGKKSSTKDKKFVEGKVHRSNIKDEELIYPRLELASRMNENKQKINALKKCSHLCTFDKQNKQEPQLSAFDNNFGDLNQRIMHNYSAIIQPSLNQQFGQIIDIRDINGNSHICLNRFVALSGNIHQSAEVARMPSILNIDQANETHLSLILNNVPNLPANFNQFSQNVQINLVGCNSGNETFENNPMRFIMQNIHHNIQPFQNNNTLTKPRPILSRYP